MPSRARQQQQTTAPEAAHAAPAQEAHDHDHGNAEMQAQLPAQEQGQTPMLDLAEQQLGAIPESGGEAQAEGPAPIVHSVRERVSETIENAPDPYGAWNGVFGWESRFDLEIDPSAGTLTIVCRIHTGASEEVKQSWKQAIDDRWGGRYTLVVAPEAEGEAEQRFSILCDLQYVDEAKDAHYEVTANEASADEGGRAGLGGTTSMTGWGVDDTVDVTHEFGHMLGMPEDYFTTNGIDHTHGGERAGFRDEGGGIMNNPAEDPFTEHYELVRQQAAEALGVDAARCSVV